MEITQYKIDQILANPEIESKIKLRKLSHTNLLEHVKNIPYKVVAASETKSADFDLPEKQKNLHIFPKKYIELANGTGRAVNVKEDRIKNMRKHTDMLSSETVQPEKDLKPKSDVSVQSQVEKEMNSVQTETTSNDSYDIHHGIDAEKIEQELATSTQAPTMENEMMSAPQVSEDNLISTNEQVNLNESNVTTMNAYIAKIDEETQLVKDVKKQATLAQEKAMASDENLNKISVEVSELEKQEEEAKRKNSELDQQLMAAYESQTRTLALARQEYEGVIKEADTRRQENENKILQFQSRIHDIRENLTDVNESIARKQEILAALQQTGFTDKNMTSFTNDIEEEKIKRIA